MDRIIEQFIKSVYLVFSDGSQRSVEFNMEERVERGETLYAIALSHNDRTITGTSEEGISMPCGGFG